MHVRPLALIWVYLCLLEGASMNTSQKTATTSQYSMSEMTPEDRAIYSFARTRDLAFDAVHALWRRRVAEGMTQKQIADAIGKDAGWVSKNLRGPGNWTLRTIGAFVEALHGEIDITIHPLEDPVPTRQNFHAYAGYECVTLAPAPGYQVLPGTTAGSALVGTIVGYPKSATMSGGANVPSSAAKP
jgi:hypothetical protein